MLTQTCFEHHAHDESCFVDLEAAERAHREWCRKQCEAGWPQPSWGGRPETVPRRHAPIILDTSWRYCPLCGTKI